MKPDGTNDTLTMPRTDPVGATWIYYVPETVGTYVLQAYFPGEWKNTRNSSGAVIARTYYQPDYSATGKSNSPTGSNISMGRELHYQPITGIAH